MDTRMQRTRISF